MTPEIREFTPDDIAEVLELWEAVPGVAAGMGDSEAGLRAFLDRNPRTSFVAVDGGSIVGAVMGGWDGRRGYIHHLAVAPSHQRKGLGKALLERTAEVFLEAGVAKVHLFVATENPAALKFYDHLGWTRRDDLVMWSFVPR